MSKLEEIIIAVDPGNSETAIVVYDKSLRQIITHGKHPNANLLDIIKELHILWPSDTTELVIEMVASYGMPVGRTVFDTCIWAGRFIQAWNRKYRLIVRKDVKMHLCNSNRATDANIRQALMERYGSDREHAIGTKKTPGPLYGLGNDERAALALAITAAETKSSYTLGENTSNEKSDPA